MADRDHLVNRYLTALERELQFRREQYDQKAWHLQTLYIGGGTPSHLSVPRLERFIHSLRSTCELHPDAEFTIEANPLDVETEKLDVLRSCGVNRISLGGQSFSNEKLIALDRDHDGETLSRALTIAARFDFQVSLDLIFAAPGETDDQWSDDLRQAIESGVDHISTYGLTIEKGTRFWSQRYAGELAELDDIPFVRFYRDAIETITAAGFDHYEVSNFAKPGRRSKHNQVYWSGQAYEAIGCSASRFDGICRETNHRSPIRYMHRIEAGCFEPHERDELTARQRALEFLVVGLRQIEGLDDHEFRTRTGFGFDDLAAEAIGQLVTNGFLERTNGRLKLTSLGLPVSDSIWERLLAGFES